MGRLASRRNRRPRECVCPTPGPPVTVAPVVIFEFDFLNGDTVAAVRVGGDLLNFGSIGPSGVVVEQLSVDLGLISIDWQSEFSFNLVTASSFTDDPVNITIPVGFTALENSTGGVIADGVYTALPFPVPCPVPLVVFALTGGFGDNFVTLQLDRDFDLDVGAIGGVTVGGTTGSGAIVSLINLGGNVAELELGALDLVAGGELTLNVPPGWSAIVAQSAGESITAGTYTGCGF